MDKLFLRISFKKSCKALSVTGGDSAPKKSDGGLPPLPLSAYRASIPCLSPRGEPAERCEGGEGKP